MICNEEGQSLSPFREKNKLPVGLLVAFGPFRIHCRYNRDAGGGNHPVAILSRTSMCWQSLTLVSAAFFPVSFHQAKVTLDSMGELALVWFLFLAINKLPGPETLDLHLLGHCQLPT